FFRLWLPTQDAHALHILSIITLVPFIVHGTLETVYHVFVITDKLRVASIWGIFISVLNFVLVILLCLYSNLGIYSIPVAALASGVFSHLTFTPFYAAYCLKEKRWYFFVKMLKGLIGFVVLIVIASGWRKLALFNVDTWLQFIANCIILAIILTLVTLII